MLQAPDPIVPRCPTCQEDLEFTLRELPDDPLDGHWYCPKCKESWTEGEVSSNYRED